jgi:hypothetical protein
MKIAQNKFACIALLILFFPLGAYLTLQNEDWSKRKLGGWIVASPFLVVIAFFAVSIVLGSLGLLDDVPEGKPIIVQEEMTPVEPSVNYTILGEEDLSFGKVKRYSVNVVIPDESVSEEQIKEVAKKIIQDYEQKGSKTTAVFFYTHESELNQGYTLAKAEWSPSGDWSKAGEQSWGYEITYDFKNKVGEVQDNKPTEQERAIIAEFRRVFENMNKTAYTPEEEVYPLVAPQFGLTPDELAEIHLKVVSYEQGW